jgi:hypothetical protein
MITDIEVLPPGGLNTRNAVAREEGISFQAIDDFIERGKLAAVRYQGRVYVTDAEKRRFHKWRAARSHPLKAAWNEYRRERDTGEEAQ